MIKLRKKHQTITRTFRLKEDWDNFLVNAAEKQNISVSTFINKIIGDYINYYSHLDRHHNLTLSKKTFNKITQDLTNQSMINAGNQSGPVRIKSTLLSRGIPVDVTGVVNLMDEILFRYTGWYEGGHKVIGDESVFILRHNLGEKWSYFLEAYFSSIFKLVLQHDIKTEKTPDMVLLYVPERSLRKNRLPILTK